MANSSSSSSSNSSSSNGSSSSEFIFQQDTYHNRHTYDSICRNDTQ